MALQLGTVHIGQVVTADGVVGTSGAETVVFALICNSGAAAPTIGAIHNGTSGSGTKLLNIQATDETSNSAFFGENGVHFPDGCYVDITTTGGDVTVVYNQ